MVVTCTHPYPSTNTVELSLTQQCDMVAIGVTTHLRISAGLVRQLTMWHMCREKIAEVLRLISKPGFGSLHLYAEIACCVVVAQPGLRPT